jgi:hypothetical protein
MEWARAHTTIGFEIWVKFVVSIEEPILHPNVCSISLETEYVTFTEFLTMMDAMSSYE